MGTAVGVNAAFVGCDHAAGEVGQDHGNVADCRDHRVGSVDVALVDEVARVCVYIGDHSKKS